MKAILVIDLPEEYIGSDIDVKLYGKNHTIHERYVNKLKLMPDKIPQIIVNERWSSSYSDAQQNYRLGWNNCIDELENECIDYITDSYKGDPEPYKITVGETRNEQ